MSRFIFYFVAAFIISVSAAVLQDCESPPRVENASIDIEDEDDTIRAIYKCQAGFELRGPSELLCDLDTDEWNEDPPECVHVQEDNEVEDEDAAVEEKKNKQHDIKEDRMVSPALASTLDMSCIQTKVKAPEIRHGFVKKYERRRRGDKIFLAASYECNDNFEFEDSEINTLYCGASKWLGELPVCINLGEYAEGDEEEYDDYAEENDDEEDIDTSSPQASTQKPKPAQEPKEISNEIASVENLDTHDPDTSEVTYEIEKHPPVEDTHTVTELPTIVETTQDPYTPRVVDYNCGSDKGGCEHKCERVLFPGENEPRIKCSCSAGFSLDPYDYAACHDINECAIKNGGCEQLCQNLPGSFQCTCESGLQIDTITGNTCVDINECEFPEIADECPDGCENTHGSYRCIAPLNNLENEKEKTNESNPNTEIRTLEIQECSTGYTFADGKCLDVDECREGSSGCENCLNLEGGYECICLPGFKLADDGKTCIDIDECAILMAENEYEVSQKSCSHVCQNTIGSFFCTCPENQHLSNDFRTCAVDTCNDLENSELNKTRCGYDCEDLTGGSFRCLCPEGYELTEDGFNCQEMSDVCAENTCAPGTCQPSEERLEFSCICPLGYEEKDSTCVDIDECSRGNHKCSHECMNTEGNYGCACPAGFRFVDGSYNECEDINECLIQEGVCGTLNCVNLVGAFNCLCSDGSEPNLEGLCSDMLQNPCTEHPCSHECLSEGQSYRCACPGNMTLDHTLINCVEADMCAFNKNGCEQICKSEESGRCGCFDGFVLDGNGKSCIDIDECQINNGGCHQLCTNFAGSYACACETGFELAADQKNCLDIDECALGQHECSHDCVNKDGGFRCICPAGYYLGETGSLCLDIDECMVMNHGCSHNCYNTQGSYMCACPEGFALSTDGRKCLNERCNKDNGGCSHLCDPENGCGCPLGWSLSEDGKTCEDIDECLYNNGFCLHKCHNTEGSFECRCPDGSKPANGDDACPITCPAGFTLSIDNPSNCEDIDECSLPGVCEFSCRNTNGSYECLCPNGYRLENGRDCVDVDECLENNSGCVGGVCINQNGTFECKCSLGYVLSNDRKTCEKLQFEMRDQCSDFVAPINGQAHCTKYRHKKKRFYNTRCKLWCNQGYRLEGPSQHYCNASGQWDDNESQCLPIVCPRIPMPRNGVILPQSCSLGTTYIGERCRLKCSAGFVPVGKSVAVCTSQMQWSYAGIFDCMPVNTESRFSNTNDFTPSIFQTLPIQPVSNIPATYQQRPLANSGWNTPAFGSVGVQRPFIKCPRNTTVFLTNGEHTAHIILEKPNTNLDYRYIESSPAWSRDLQAHLGPGTYAVVFRGHDPVTGRKARCKTVINVRHIDGPRVVFCTNSFEVQMAENQGYRSVVWEEPRFESKYGFKKIYKSRIPGELFGIGVHNVFYEATNDDGLTAKCEFKIYVKEATAFNKPSVPSMNLTPYKDDSLLKAINNPKYTGVQRPLSLALSSSVSQSHLTPVSHPSIVNSQLLAGHESFIICPGQKPVKVTHAQTVELPPNCILKNVRLNHFRQFTSQRLLPRFWNSFYN